MRYVLFTNSVDFAIVDENDVGLFLYDSTSRTWSAVVAGFDHPIRLRSKINGSMITGLSNCFVQVHQQYIINVNYLLSVVDNKCRFAPPYDNVDYVTLGRVYRKKLLDSLPKL